MKLALHLLSALLITSLTLPCLSAAQENDVDTLEDLAAAQALVERAIKTIEQGGVSEALDLLRPYWPLPKAEIDEVVKKFDAQHRVLESRFGKRLGIELAGTQAIGDSFRRYLYLEKYERHGIVWVFGFYRPKEEWIVSTVFYTAQLEELYEWN